MTARHRSRSQGPRYTTLTFSRHNSSGRELASSTSPPVVSFNETEVMDDHVIPGFNKRVSSGEVFVNPCSYVKDTFETVGSGHLKWIRTNGDVYEYTGPVTTRLGQFEENPGFLPAPTTDVDYLSSAQLIALGNLDRTPYSFAEDIGEIRETLKFLNHPWKSLDDLSWELTSDVRTLMSRKHALSLAEAIASVWLQYRFAFSPLVRSANDLLEAVSTKTYSPHRRTARGSADWEASDSDDATISGHRYVRDCKISNNYRAGILYEDYSPIQDWRDKYGLRFKDIPETLWALTPLSFVVDRFLNFSASLRGLSSFLDPNIKILGAWTTVRSTYNASNVLLEPNSSIVQSVPIPNTSESNTRETFSYVREVWEPTISDFIPPLRLKDLVDTSAELADLAALWVARLR